MAEPRTIETGSVETGSVEIGSVDEVFMDLVMMDEEWLAAEFAATVADCAGRPPCSAAVLTVTCPSGLVRIDSPARPPVPQAVELLRAGLRIGRQRAPPRGAQGG